MEVFVAEAETEASKPLPPRNPAEALKSISLQLSSHFHRTVDSASLRTGEAIYKKELANLKAYDPQLAQTVAKVWNDPLKKTR